MASRGTHRCVRLADHLIALIPKMEELTAGPSGISAKFRQDAAAVGQMAAEANQTLPPSQEDAARESAWGELEEVGKTQPIAAVIAAWFEVEQAAIAVAESLNLDRRNTRPITSPKIVADQLVRQELIAPEFSRLAAELSSFGTELCTRIPSLWIQDRRSSLLPVVNLC